MKPDRRRAGIVFRPRVPWVDGLGLSVDEAPAPGAALLGLHQCQVGFEDTAIWASHEFGAEEWSVVVPEVCQASIQGGCVAIRVKTDHVTV